MSLEQAITEENIVKLIGDIKDDVDEEHKKLIINCVGGNLAEGDDVVLRAVITKIRLDLSLLKNAHNFMQTESDVLMAESSSGGIGKKEFFKLYSEVTRKMSVRELLRLDEAWDKLPDNRALLLQEKSQAILESFKGGDQEKYQPFALEIAEQLLALEERVEIAVRAYGAVQVNLKSVGEQLNVVLDGLNRGFWNKIKGGLSIDGGDAKVAAKAKKKLEELPGSGPLSFLARKSFNLPIWRQYIIRKGKERIIDARWEHMDRQEEMSTDLIDNTNLEFDVDELLNKESLNESEKHFLQAILLMASEMDGMSNWAKNIAINAKNQMGDVDKEVKDNLEKLKNHILTDNEDATAYLRRKVTPIVKKLKLEVETEEKKDDQEEETAPPTEDEEEAIDLTLDQMVGKLGKTIEDAGKAEKHMANRGQSELEKLKNDPQYLETLKTRDDRMESVLAYLHEIQNDPNKMTLVQEAFRSI